MSKQQQQMLQQHQQQQQQMSQQMTPQQQQQISQQKQMTPDQMNMHRQMGGIQQNHMAFHPLQKPKQDMDQQARDTQQQPEFPKTHEDPLHQTAPPGVDTGTECEPTPTEPAVSEVSEQTQVQDGPVIGPHHGHGESSFIPSPTTDESKSVAAETVEAAPPPAERTLPLGPASIAANSHYAKQYAMLKRPKPPPPGVVRHYSETPIFKSKLKLFDYQLDGLNWLLNLWDKGRNGILADEMGLGKTVQTIAFFWHLVFMERMRGPFLVVAPLSTLDHWRKTAEEWTDLNAVYYYDEKLGRDVIRKYEWYYQIVDCATRKEPLVVDTGHYKFHLILTTYETFMADVDILAPITWQFIVIDEAHKLKNRVSKNLSTLKQIACRHMLLLTGTPVQNNTEEMWPLLNFIEPVKFPDVEGFKQEFGDLQDEEQVAQLTTLLKPHLLRRVKEDVAHTIPPLEETIIDVQLTILQKAYYRAIFERNRAFLYKNLGAKKAAPSLMNIEMELRKCCNHPFHIAGVAEKETSGCKTPEDRMKKLIEGSGKMVLLDKLLPKLKAEGHKVLIFSQFNHTLSLIEEFLNYNEWRSVRLDGQVPVLARNSSISKFNDPTADIFVFLLSTRAGGLGINLTSADTVIIFDSDWNPQNDVQATARAHRIGQEREVKVYRLVTARTYEAEMFERASKKLGLNTAMFHRGAFDVNKKKREEEAKMHADPTAAALNKSEIEELLRHGAYYLLESSDASREFQESNIDEILSKNSRLVRYQMSGQSSTFAKTSFKSDNTNDLQLDDPDFWKKVLKDSSSHSLLARLNDGSVLATAENIEEYMRDLTDAVTTLSAEEAPEPILESLIQVASLPAFSDEQRRIAENLLLEAQRKLEEIGYVPPPELSDDDEVSKSPRRRRSRVPGSGERKDDDHNQRLKSRKKRGKNNSSSTSYKSLMREEDDAQFMSELSGFSEDDSETESTRRETKKSKKKSSRISESQPKKKIKKTKAKELSSQRKRNQSGSTASDYTSQLLPGANQHIIPPGSVVEQSPLTVVAPHTDIVMQDFKSASLIEEPGAFNLPVDEISDSMYMEYQGETSAQGSTPSTKEEDSQFPHPQTQNISSSFSGDGLPIQNSLNNPFDAPGDDSHESDDEETYNPHHTGPLSVGMEGIDNQMDQSMLQEKHLMQNREGSDYYYHQNNQGAPTSSYSHMGTSQGHFSSRSSSPRSPNSSSTTTKRRGRPLGSKDKIPRKRSKQPLGMGMGESGVLGYDMEGHNVFLSPHSPTDSPSKPRPLRRMSVEEDYTGFMGPQQPHSYMLPPQQEFLSPPMSLGSSGQIPHMDHIGPSAKGNLGLQPWEQHQGFSMSGYPPKTQDDSRPNNQSSFGPF
eukprot:GHVP01069756.1.p1 GENE.GHVP01069756.1~~GHVP01069756.1.p1  ORF type:complete len:1432 (+),score=313.49 GHVP01069756.1:212-4297(+)